MTQRKTEFTGKHIIVFTRDGWEFVERTKAREAVAVVATTESRKVILTEQYRRPVDARVIDWPAGLIGDEGDDADAATTARRELEEETGYEAMTFERLASGPTSPGITSEIVHFYRARDAKQKGKGGGVGGEDIEVHAVPLRDVRTWLDERENRGVLIDAKVWAGLYFLSVE